MQSWNFAIPVPVKPMVALDGWRRSEANSDKAAEQQNRATGRNEAPGSKLEFLPPRIIPESVIRAALAIRAARTSHDNDQGVPIMDSTRSSIVATGAAAMATAPRLFAQQTRQGGAAMPFYVFPDAPQSTTTAG
jgi:hypothetical protein